jgi:rod shape-determining protein MreC
MLRKPHYIALGIVLLVTVVLLKLPSRTATKLKLAISALNIPFFGAVSSAQKTIEKAGNAVTPRKELLAQLEESQKQIKQLQLRSMQLESLAQENNRLRAHLQIPKEVLWQGKWGRVVAKDPANWWRTIRIDRGSRDGMLTNAAVITEEGLVGRVSEVGFTHSQVVLVGDPDCGVSVLVEESRDHGMIRPTASVPLDPSIVELNWLPRNAKLAPGQRVVTSGLSNFFPKGILVGHVVDFRSVGYGLYTEARIKLAVNMNALEEVFVLLP